MRNLFTLLLFLIVYTGFAQVTFEKSFGGPESDEGMSVIAIPGGYVICGTSASFSSGPAEIYIIRTNLYGDTIWTRTFGGDGLYAASSIISNESGDLVVCGTLYDIAMNQSDIFLVKLNLAGDTLWTRREFSPLESYGNSIAETGDGYILCGYSTLLNGTMRMLLVKADTAGYPVWVKNYGDPFETSGSSVMAVDGGDIIACGGIDNEIPMWNRNIFAVRTNSSGDTLWTRQYGGADYDYAWDISPDAGDGCIITGYTQGQITPDGNILAVHIAADGSQDWQHQYGRSGLDMGYSGEATGDGGYVFCGQSAEEGSELQTAILVRTDGSGDTLWTADFGTYPKNYARDVHQAADGGFFLCGGTSSPDFSYYDVYLVKTDDQGQVTTGIKGPSWKNQVRITPNPSSGAFVVDLPMMTQRVMVTDETGKVIKEYAEERLKKLEKLPINLTEARPGLYFIIIHTTTDIFSHKVIVSSYSK
jgi:hypothetical protein